MDVERWQRLSPLLDAIFELEGPERAQRLASLRAQDPALADELEALMALEEGEENFLDKPLVPSIAGLSAGSVIGPYRLERMIGEGGMGQVWLAGRADGLYQRRVALKLLRPGLADTNLRLRFTRERQILARLAHPNIARLLDAGVADNVPYLALEYVEGEPITDYCKRHATPVEARLRMFQQICDAVSHAHANLIVHRDLKPSNILVTPAGEVRLLDFGIAKLLDTEAPVIEQTRTGMRAFTLHYAAPEQIRGEPVTTMTDVYSLGVVLYELLTDAKPYRLKRNTDAEWEEAILAVDPLRPSQTILRRSEGETRDPAAARRLARYLSGDLDNIVLKALAKRPEHRYPSVEAVAQDILRFESGRPVLARPQSLGYRMRKYVIRHRWALAAGSMTTMVIGLALGIVAWQAREAVHEASRAQAMQDFMAGLFEHAGDLPAGGTLDLRKLLDVAVERGDRELARQPRARAELLGMIARLRSGLGDYRQAHALLDRQAAIIDVTDDIPVSLRLESMSLRGEMLRRLGEPAACVDLMHPALHIARREQAQLPPQAADFYSQLGRCRQAVGERQIARVLFERALTLRRGETGMAVGEIESRLDLAALTAESGDTTAAVRAYEDARTRLRREAGERHPLLVSIGRRLGALHRLTGRFAAAEQELRDALALANEVSGPQHPNALSVRRELAGVLLARGQHVQASQELEEHHRGLLERHGADYAELRESHRALSQVQWQRGDVAAARASLREALRISERGGDAGQIGEVVVELAELELAAGDPSGALVHARRAAALAAGADADTALALNAERLTAEAAIATGEPALARLERVATRMRQLHGPDHALTRRTELALARHQARAGEPRGFARLDALSALADADRALQPVAWRARAYAAEARCIATAAGAAQASRSLQALLARLRQAQPEGGALTREVDAIRSDCERRQSQSAVVAGR